MTISGSPIGQFAAFAQIMPPDTGWLPCGGQFVKESDYPLLIAMFEAANEEDGALWELSYLEEDYGVFLPAMVSERFLAGVHPDYDAFVAGEYGGAKTHALSEAENAQHNHSLQWWGDGGGSGTSIVPYYVAGKSPNTDYGAIGTSGSGTPHNNMPPYLTAIYHISAK